MTASPLHPEVAAPLLALSTAAALVALPVALGIVALVAAFALTIFSFSLRKRRAEKLAKKAAEQAVMEVLGKIR